MQCTSAAQQVQFLYQKICASAHSWAATVCLREADAAYLESQTLSDIEFRDALRPIDYRVAIKARSRSIYALLEHLYVLAINS